MPPAKAPKKTAAAKAPAKKSAPASRAKAKAPAKRGRGGVRPSTAPKKTTEKRKAASAKRAAAAVGKARAAGAVGPHGNRAQRSLRNAAIIARLECGATTKEVAQEFRVAERTVLDVQAQRAKAPSPLEALPMAIIEGLAKDYRAAIADFEAMAYRHADLNPSVALGAMKGAIVARERYVELLNLIGKLPDNLELFRAEAVLRRLAEEMMDAMEKVEEGELSVSDAAAFFKEIVQGSDRHQLGVGA